MKISRSPALWQGTSNYHPSEWRTGSLERARAIRTSRGPGVAAFRGQTAKRPPFAGIRAVPGEP